MSAGASEGNIFLWLQRTWPSCAFILIPISFQLSNSIFPCPFLLSALPSHPPSISQRLERLVNWLYLVLGHRQTLEGSGKLVFIFYIQDRAFFHSLAPFLLQPVVTLTSGDHIGNTHTEMTQLQFEPRLLYFILVCPLMKLYLPVSLAL